MKKIFVASAFLGLATMAQAAFIQCSPAQADTVVNATGQTATFTCNPGQGVGAGAADDNWASDGFNVQTIRIRVSGTFQENAAPTGASYSVLFTGAEGSSEFVIPSGSISCTASGSEGVAPATSNQALGACSATSAFVSVTGTPDVVSSFQVTVSGGAGSTPLPFNGSASVLYEVTASAPTPPPSIPEPSTYAMMAAGLVSFYMVRRRA